MSRWILIWRAYSAIRFPCLSASSHVARVFHARSRMITCHTSPFLRITGLLIAECPQLSEVEAGERSSVTGDHDRGLRVSERADPQIGRADVRTPVTLRDRMPSS